MKNAWNFSRLVGTLSAGDDMLGEKCSAMKKLCYEGVYFNDIFFKTVPKDSSEKEDLIFREDDCDVVFRHREEIEKIKETVESNGLCIPSSHFLQVLPPPGESASWIFPVHERLLDIAAQAGMKRVTTHIGWMFGVANEYYLKEYAIGFKSGKIPLEELNRKCHEVYGQKKLYSDSVEIYRRLCAKAMAHGISVSIETACSEYPDICFDIEKIICFIKETGASNLGICVDSGHCHFNGLDPADVIRKAGRYFLETHFHDNFGDRDRHNPVGIGTINWLDVINAMRDIDYQGEITFEQSDYENNAKNWRFFVKEADRYRK